MSEVRKYKCDYYTVTDPAPAKSCFFCAHCTDVIWDYSGPYAFVCDIEADTRMGASGECASFFDVDECKPQTSCPYCKYEGTDEDASHLNENIYSDDSLMVNIMFDGGLSVWFNPDGPLAPKYVPINYCPMCGRKL